MSAPIKIRNLTNEDFPIIVDILKETQKDSYEFTLFNEASIRSRIQESKLSVQVAERNGEILHNSL